MIDTRGLSCPEPVVLTKQAVDSGAEEMEILADTPVSKENIIRFLEHENFTVEIQTEGDEFRIIAKKEWNI
ncbi:MAG: sulfurtransferase TusA family protein [Tissierellia bacterium]|nr:sulfurtransferase TusA family protein [Tissierellia bacterium]